MSAAVLAGVVGVVVGAVLYTIAYRHGRRAGRRSTAAALKLCRGYDALLGRTLAVLRDATPRPPTPERRRIDGSREPTTGPTSEYGIVRPSPRPRRGRPPDYPR